jgi:hypothetical protein
MKLTFRLTVAPVLLASSASNAAARRALLSVWVGREGCPSVIPEMEVWVLIHIWRVGPGDGLRLRGFDGISDQCAREMMLFNNDILNILSIVELAALGARLEVCLLTLICWASIGPTRILHRRAVRR